MLLYDFFLTKSYNLRQMHFLIALVIHKITTAIN